MKTFIKVVFVLFFKFPASYLIALREGCEDGERARVSVIFLSSITLVVVDHPQHLHICKNNRTIWNVVFVLSTTNTANIFLRTDHLIQ
jgi:hypothetical protein